MRRLGGIVWLLILICSIVLIGVRFYQGNPLQTDFLSLLPDEEQNEAVRQANDRMKEAVTQRVIVLLKSKDFVASVQSAEQLITALDPFAQLEKKQNDMEGLGKRLFPYRAGLLSHNDRELLQNGQGDQIAKRALAQIMSPFAGMDSQLIINDPYLLFPSYLTQLSKAGEKLDMRDGWLIGDGYIVLIFKLKNKAFDNRFQKDFTAAFDDIVFTNETEVIKTGAIFYAQKGAEQAEREATSIGLLSLFGIIVLNLLVFRSVRPILLSLIAISSGVLGGLATTLLLFGDLHLMAFVFGAGLIGIAVDYTFHYVCENALDAQERVRQILRPLSFGVISSALGFLILAIAPFPGLQQIAVFAASGLMMAYLCVMTVYPLVDKKAACRIYVRLWNVRPVFSKGVGGLCLLLALAGIGRFHIDDDVRRLQNLPSDLKMQEDRIRELTGMDNTVRVLLVQGEDEEQVLQREEALDALLLQQMQTGSISGYRSLAQIIPSKKRQDENRNLLEQSLFRDNMARHQMLIGLMPDGGVYDMSGYAIIDDGFEELRLTETLHLIRINGVSDATALSDALSSHEGVYLLDQAKNISQTLGKYRERAMLLIAMACLVILLFLCSRYGWRDGIRIWAIPLFATLVTPFITALLGESFTFFNSMALLLVLAIGLDYALFSFEASGCNVLRVVLANALSAFSTILAFGLLSFSDLYAIHAFGLTIMIGIVIAFAMAPLVRRM